MLDDDDRVTEAVPAVDHQMVDASDIELSFGRWLTGSVRSSEERAVRARCLARVMGGWGLGRRMQLGGRVCPSTTAVPTDLAVLIESQVQLRYAASCLTVEGMRIYSIPRWLAWVSRKPGRLRLGVRVRLYGQGHRIAVEDAATGDELEHDAFRGVMMRRQCPGRRRREHLAGLASALVDDVTTILGAPPLGSGWLRRTVDDPMAAEQDALALWKAFVMDCALPASFQAPGRVLSLRDVLVLRSGSDGGCHRVSFANQQPWAARMLLAGPDPDKALRPVDSNPARAIPVAAEVMCCGDEGAPCEKAVLFVRRIARYRNDSELDRLLGGTSGHDVRIRSLLLEACKEDGGELLSHIRGDVQQTREQIDRAIDLYYACRAIGGKHSCAYSLATLAIRVMVRHAFDPKALEPHTVASGIVTMAADCLAGYLAKRLSDPSVQLPESDADAVDAGVLAFIALVGATRRPGLTARQLVKLAAAASQRGIHQIETVKGHVDASWPVPSGWEAVRAHVPLRGVEPLTCIADLVREGDQMQHCLREGYYNRDAVLGDLALFSLRSGGRRATLALKPIERKGDGGETRIDRWKIHDLRGKANADVEPGSPCERVAGSLLDQLNEGCPKLISQDELARRIRIRELMVNSRTFNRDLVSARQRWAEIYADYLPPRLASVPPAKIVDAYLSPP